MPAPPNKAPSKSRITLYTPHRGQRRIHKRKIRFRVVACGRRFGKTLMACNEIVKFALDHPGANCAWVAPWFRQSKIAYRLIRRAFAKPGDSVIVRKSDSDLRLEFANGSVLQFFSAENHDAIRGDGYHFIVIDEAGDALRDPKVWTDTIRAALSDTNGQALIIGTPKGRNFFFQLFARGEDPEYPDWASFHARTADNPYIPASEIAAAKKELPADAFEQEYDARFLEEGAGVFKGIDACIRGTLEPNCERIAGHTYVLGFDPAKYQDYSVVTVVDCHTRQVVYWQRINQIDYTVQLDMVASVADRFRAFILIDMTGVGDPLLEQLKKLKRGRHFSVEGYLFTNASKKALVEQLQLGIQNRDIAFPDIPVMLNELRQFEYQLSPSRMLTYSAPKGAHDDCVISLALAYMAASTPRKDSGGVLLATEETNEVLPTTSWEALTEETSWYRESEEYDANRTPYYPEQAHDARSYRALHRSYWHEPCQYHYSYHRARNDQRRAYCGPARVAPRHWGTGNHQGCAA